MMLYNDIYIHYIIYNIMTNKFIMNNIDYKFIAILLFVSNCTYIQS